MAVYTVLVCALLFASAGTVRWPSAWAWIVCTTVAQTILLLVIDRRHPDLLAERAHMQAGTKKWDKIVVPLMTVGGPLLMFTGAGLDFRWHGLRFPVWVTIAGLLVVLAGARVTGTAMYANRFFASTVRIQTDRGQVVVRNGP